MMFEYYTYFVSKMVDLIDFLLCKWVVFISEFPLTLSVLHGWAFCNFLFWLSKWNNCWYMKVKLCNCCLTSSMLLMCELVISSGIWTFNFSVSLSIDSTVKIVSSISNDMLPSSVYVSFWLCWPVVVNYIMSIKIIISCSHQFLLQWLFFIN